MGLSEDLVKSYVFRIRKEKSNQLPSQNVTPSIVSTRDTHD
jgi:hypothetical protein